jgi:hypothetical protein
MPAQLDEDELCTGALAWRRGAHDGLTTAAAWVKEGDGKWMLLTAGADGKICKRLPGQLGEAPVVELQSYAEGQQGPAAVDVMVASQDGQHVAVGDYEWVKVGWVRSNGTAVVHVVDAASVGRTQRCGLALPRTLDNPFFASNSSRWCT